MDAGIKQPLNYTLKDGEGLGLHPFLPDWVVRGNTANVMTSLTRCARRDCFEKGKKVHLVPLSS